MIPVNRGRRAYRVKVHRLYVLGTRAKKYENNNELRICDKKYGKHVDGGLVNFLALRSSDSPWTK